MVTLGFCSLQFSRLTDEIRDIFAALGSTMIGSLKPMDSWVFAGAYGMKRASAFEKVWIEHLLIVKHVCITLYLNCVLFCLCLANSEWFEEQCIWRLAGDGGDHWLLS